MAHIDSTLIGSVINELPLDRMISGPLQAMITAQIQASRAYADFLMSICIKDGKAISVEFDYDETLTDDTGIYKGTVSKTFRIPLLAAISHPNITIEEGTIEFELTVSQQAEEHSEAGAEGALEAKLGWGPFNVSVKGAVSQKSAQTRKTDTRARYSISTKVSRQPPSECLLRVMDVLTEAACKPYRLPDADTELPKPNTLTGGAP